jgi:predicted hydrocarbon binding protein
MTVMKEYNKTEKFDKCCSEIVSSYAVRKLFHHAVLNKMDCKLLLQKHEWMTECLYNVKEWISVSQWVELLSYFSAELNQSIIEIGYLSNISNKYDNIQIKIIKLLPIHILKKVISQHVLDTMNRNTLVSLIHSENKVITEYRCIEKRCFPKEFCEYNIGAVKAFLEIKGYKNIKFIETECIFKNDEKCSITYTWTNQIKRPYFTLLTDLVYIFFNNRKHIKNYVWESMGINNPPKTLDDFKAEYLKE